MAETDHVTMEKQRQFDVKSFGVPPVAKSQHCATVLETNHAGITSHGNLPKVERMVNQGFSESNARATTVFGALQTLAGLLAVAFQAVATGIGNNSNSQPTVQFLGCGIWCGILFLITGILGIEAGRKKSRSMVVALLTLCIISSIMVWVLIIITAIDLALMNICPLRSYTNRIEDYDYQNYYNESASATRKVFITFNITDMAPDCSSRSGAIGVTLKAMDSLLMIIAVFEFATAVTTASICCRVLSCCRNSLTANLCLHNVSAQPSKSPRVSTMQPNMLAKGPLVHDNSLPIYTMEAGPILVNQSKSKSAQ